MDISDVIRIIDNAMSDAKVSAYENKIALDANYKGKAEALSTVRQGIIDFVNKENEAAAKEDNNTKPDKASNKSIKK